MHYLRIFLKFFINNKIRLKQIIFSYLRWKTSFYNHLDDKSYLSKVYLVKFGRNINWNNPMTFNEKLNWLKVYDRTTLYTKLADKYEVKQFVSDVIGKEYVVNNLFVYERPEELDINSLPEKFIIKSTHDSSGAFICRDKKLFDKKVFLKKYKKMKNYYYYCREWPYLNIKPRIIVDEYLNDELSGDYNIPLIDYKFWCFNGIPQYVYCTIKGRNIYENFYDMNFYPVNINHGFPRHEPEFKKPINFEKMIYLAQRLAIASQACFIRVDFFNVKGKIYFGEFTFYDWAGLRPFASYEQDKSLGELIVLPERKE